MLFDTVATNILGVSARAMLNALLERETCGKKRAVAHTILVIACYVLQRRQPYQDLGSNYFDESDQPLRGNQFAAWSNSEALVTLETTEAA